jgi:2-succinyl-6-hydroxy-2,4-cyclohexadiene-1-carboxylate synthase
LTQPVYFFAGADDRIMEPKYVRHLASFHYLFDGCGNNVFELSDCGHMGMLEQPDWIVKVVGFATVQSSGIGCLNLDHSF